MSTHFLDKNLLKDSFSDTEPVTVLSGHKAAPFPLEKLPEKFRRYVEEMARLKGAPPDYIAIPSLIMFATFLGTRLLYQPLTDNEALRLHPVLWGALIAPSGSNKGSSLAPLKPLYEEDKKLSLLHERALEEYEKEKAHWARAKKRGEDVSPPQKPRMGRAVISSTTIEAIGVILQDNPQGIALVSNELGQFIRGLGQYKGGRGEDRDQWLAIWDNEPIRVDRLSRGSIAVERPFVNIFGTIQPEKASKLLLGDSDGMSQRFQLLIYPDENLSGMINENMDTAVRKTMNGLIEEIKTSSFGEPMGNGTYLLRSTPEACQIYLAYSDYIVKKKRAYEAALKSHLNKYPYLVARLAAVLHCVQVVERGTGVSSTEPISSETMQDAISIAETYLWPHAKRVYKLLGSMDFEKGAQRIAGYLIEHPKLQTLKIAEIQNKGWSGLKNSKQVKDSFEHLQVCGWLLKIDKPSGVKGGRPSTDYWVNPKIHKMSAGPLNIKEPEWRIPDIEGAVSSAIPESDKAQNTDIGKEAIEVTEQGSQGLKDDGTHTQALNAEEQAERAYTEKLNARKREILERRMSEELNRF